MIEFESPDNASSFENPIWLTALGSGLGNWKEKSDRTLLTRKRKKVKVMRETEELDKAMAVLCGVIL